MNQIFEIDSNNNAKRIFFSGDTQPSFQFFRTQSSMVSPESNIFFENLNKHITQLSASLVSENYVILGNPFRRVFKLACSRFESHSLIG